MLILRKFPDLEDREVAARSYIDLTAAIAFARNYTFRVGANNLLDRDPPLVGQANCAPTICKGNTFSQVYDTLGRQWFASVVRRLARRTCQLAESPAAVATSSLQSGLLPPSCPPSSAYTSCNGMNGRVASV